MELKKLIYKLILGLILLLAGAWVVRLIFNPSSYYGNDILQEKMRDYEPAAGKFNTVFIGSSIFLQNFNPVYFDSLMPPSLGIATYNLGSGGTLPPETYVFYENLLKHHGSDLRYAFIELRDISLFHPHNLHTIRKRYWMTPAEYGFILNTSIHSSIPNDLKKNSILFYGVSLMERMFNVDYFNDIYGHIANDQKSSKNKLKLIRKANLRGYLPVEGRSIRQEQFLMDTSRLSLVAGLYRKFDAETDSSYYSRAHLRRIQKLISESGKKGIHCFFVLQPKMSVYEMKEIVAILKHLPEEHVINLADPDRYPSLYLARNSFSESHFNMDGTHILTRLLAERFLDHIGKHQAVPPRKHLKLNTEK